MTQNRYQLVRGEDQTVWVSVQPLMLDIRENLDKILAMRLDQLNEDDKAGLDMRILGLKSTYQMLEALVTEVNIREAQESVNAAVKH